jgi:hypothetical protein
MTLATLLECFGSCSEKRRDAEHAEARRELNIAYILWLRPEPRCVIRGNVWILFRLHWTYQVYVKANGRRLIVDTRAANADI